MNVVIYKNDFKISQSNVVRRCLEKRALDILYKNNEIDEGTYTKMQEKIKVKYARGKNDLHI